MKPVVITQENFVAEVESSPIPVVIDFWAPWCGPCRVVGPILDGLAERYDGRVKVAKINVDEEPALAGAFQIRGIPTLHAMNGGKVVRTIVGIGNPSAIPALFDDLSGSVVGEGVAV